MAGAGPTPSSTRRSTGWPAGPTAKAGAILVNVNPAYRSHELAYVVNQSDMRLLVSATTHKTTDHRALTPGIMPDCPALVDVFYIGTPEFSALSTFSGDGLASRLATLSADDPVTIQYTSGTTGFLTDLHMPEVAISYGMTETSPVSLMTRSDDSLARRTETVGRSMPHLESKIVDPESGLTVARGSPANSAHVATPSCSVTGTTRR